MESAPCCGHDCDGRFQTHWWSLDNVSFCLTFIGGVPTVKEEVENLKTNKKYSHYYPVVSKHLHYILYEPSSEHTYPLWNSGQGSCILSLQAQQCDDVHAYLQGKARQREGREDSGTAPNLAVVEARVRASDHSLNTFVLSSIFSPAKDLNKTSLTYIMPLREVRPARRRRVRALQRKSPREL